jgi:4-amino-4-deoxy-L-arabinose transferase-like glycosyltransferase
VESPQKGARGVLIADAWRLAIVVTIAGTLARLVVAALTPLFPDETYYWEFSRRLATGYFDHPPVIAWLVRLGTMVFGDTPLGVRFGAVVAGGVAALFTAAAAAARRLRGPRGALIAAVVFALMPLSTGLTLATPDAPLLCFVAATLYALLRALEHQARSPGSLRWWRWAGVTPGRWSPWPFSPACLPSANCGSGCASRVRTSRPRLRFSSSPRSSSGTQRTTGRHSRFSSATAWPP